MALSGNSGLVAACTRWQGMGRQLQSPPQRQLVDGWNLESGILERKVSREMMHGTPGFCQVSSVSFHQVVVTDDNVPRPGKYRIDQLGRDKYGHSEASCRRNAAAQQDEEEL